TVVKNSPVVENDLNSIPKSTWDTVHQGMWSVVNQPGGTVTSLYTNFGVTVAGKTGTSQISKSHPNNALFVSYAPYNNPDISITGVIPNGYTSHNAAELVRDVYSYYFKLQTLDEIFGGKVKPPETNVDSAIE
ncbi:MAG TPA: penicillin-binding transpeptidase domain-containing protein, partial [Mobilitalea sp.]|nr:penicillin-binding transpeptidase domain-containing protein [Mobilitalea sp.]